MPAAVPVFAFLAAQRETEGRVCWSEAGQLCDFRGVEGESSKIRSGEWCQRVAKAF